MKKYALIMAAGEGRRAGSELPKQFVKLLGIPMLWWSVMAFHEEDPQTRIIVVLHPGFFDDWDIMLGELPAALEKIGLNPGLAQIPVKTVCGGRTRSESVKNGLLSVPEDYDTMVAVHDAARPLVSRQTIFDVFEGTEEHGNCIAVIPVTDSLRYYPESEDYYTRPVNRNLYQSVQTPQCFLSPLLKEAFRKTEGKEYTDEATRYQQLDFKELVIIMRDGTPENFKVTNPMDFLIAETLLRHRLGLS